MLVGPRIFPLLATSKGYGCDQALEQETIAKEFPQFELVDVPRTIWKRGINSIPEDEFCDLARRFIVWCKGLNLERIYIVSHDGTQTAYRKYLGESATRENFLGDTGWYQTIV